MIAVPIVLPGDRVRIVDGIPWGGRMATIHRIHRDAREYPFDVAVDNVSQQGEGVGGTDGLKGYRSNELLWIETAESFEGRMMGRARVRAGLSADGSHLVDAT